MVSAEKEKESALLAYLYCWFMVPGMQGYLDHPRPAHPGRLHWAELDPVDGGPETVATAAPGAAGRLAIITPPQQTTLQPSSVQLEAVHIAALCSI